jgi:hypothetical protein
MKSNLVRLDYQGIAVSFNEDGWTRAVAMANRFRKRPVVYALIHQDGVCKIGKTGNLKKRLKLLRNHGINRAAVALVAIPARNAHAAEKKALALAGRIAPIKVAAEVFQWIPPGVIKAVLRHSARSTRHIKQHKPPGLSCQELAKATCLFWQPSLADLEAAVDFFLSMIGSTEDMFFAATAGLRWHVLRLVPVVNSCIASLAVSQQEVPDRKKILESAVLELRLLLPTSPHSESA